MISPLRCGSGDTVQESAMRSLCHQIQATMAIRRCKARIGERYTRGYQGWRITD